MPCDDLPYIVFYLVLAWACIVAWAGISVLEWHKDRKLAQEYQGLYDSLVRHANREARKLVR